MLTDDVLNDVIFDFLVEGRDKSGGASVGRYLHARGLADRSVLLRLLDLLEGESLSVVVLKGLNQLLKRHDVFVTAFNELVDDLKVVQVDIVPFIDLATSLIVVENALRSGLAFLFDSIQLISVVVVRL